MSVGLDSLIRKGKDLEIQIEQLNEELTRLRSEIGRRMGDQREYYGKGIVARKWARMRWQINKELLLDELSADALNYLKEVVLSKEKLTHAIKAGYLPPRLYDRAVQCEQVGWNISLKVVETPESEPEWENDE
jgi:hypothetical protein